VGTSRGNGEDVEEQADYLERQFLLEGQLNDSGVLKDDFSIIIAQKKVEMSGLLRKGKRYLQDLRGGK
jgi:hypothetical protein